MQVLKTGLDCTYMQIMGPEETQLPNGMGWDMKKSVMYLADTFMKEFGETPGVVWEMRVDKQGLPVRDSAHQLQRRLAPHSHTALERPLRRRINQSWKTKAKRAQRQS